MHDSTHISRVYLLEKTLSAGQIPAIWASDITDGAGYPLFHFYAPLAYYLALAAKLFTGSYFVGLKFVLLLSTMLGMSGMYLLVRKWGRAAGIVSSISYAVLPYAAVNLYVRGAFAEYLAMGLLPWVFYVWIDLSTKRKQVIAAFITALFLLSHNLIPLITAPLLLIWIIINKPQDLKRWIIPTVATLTLSVFYLLPLLFERSFVMADTVARTTNYALHYVSPSQLWNSTWGYGGSGVGLEDGMSFKIGKVQLILAVLASLLIIARKKYKQLFFVLAAIFAYFMSTEYSSILWSSVGVLSIVQFPWRFLVLGGFFASVLAGYAVTLLPTKVLQSLLGTSFVILLLIFNLKYFVPQTTFVSNPDDFTSQNYLNTLPSIVPEYQPIWTSTQDQISPDYTVLPQLYYPTWQVVLDSSEVMAVPVNGHLAFYNPKASSNYSIKQIHTRLENIATIISLISLIYLLKLYVKN